MVHLKNKEICHIPTEQLDFMKRNACQYCPDYTSEFADLSFGGLGSPEGWTTVITRSKAGQKVLTEALGSTVEIFSHKHDPLLATQVLEKAKKWSEKKKESARKNRLKRMQPHDEAYKKNRSMRS